MNKRETVQALMDSIQKGDFEIARSMLAENFQFSGPVPQPINAEAWLGMSASMKAAFPNLDYRFKVIGAEGDMVRAVAQLSGTQSGPFDLTGMDMGVIPATHKNFSTKTDKMKITVKDDKVSAWVVEPNDASGLMEILKQLDIKMPVA